MPHMDPVLGRHPGLEKFRQHFRFRFEPMVEGAAVVAVLCPP